METSERLIVIRDFLADKLPPLFGAVAPTPLPDFERYIDEPPFNVDDRELAVYMAEGSWDDQMETESFVLQAQLPKETRPDKYNSIIWKTLQTFIVKMLQHSLVSHLNNSMM